MALRIKHLKGLQTGGTTSLDDATNPDPTGSPSGTRPIIYQVPLDAAPGLFYYDSRSKAVISAAEAHAALAANSVQLVMGAPPELQSDMINGKFPASLIPNIDNPAIQSFLAVPQPGPQEDIDFPPPDVGGPGGAGGGGQGTSEQFQPVGPPVVDILQEMSARRQAQRDAATTAFESIVDAAPSLAPEGVRFFPGLNPGGIADIAIGQMAGAGDPSSVIPTGMREFSRIPLPDISVINEPSLQSEFAPALGLANQILNAIRLFQTGRSQQSTSGGGGGSSGQSDIDLAVAQALIGQIVGGVGLQ